jgi:RNA polymerase-binding transcription factor DksA
MNGRKASLIAPTGSLSAPSHIAGTVEHLATIGRWDGMTAGAFESIAEFDSVKPTDLLIADRVSTEARIVSLERDWTGIVESSAMTSADDEHDPEGATIAFERAQIETLIEVAREHLDEIDDALERVRTGAYGTCEDCGQPIAAARLEARPYATTCISCASRRR